MIRITGMNSGLDTDSIIQELMKAQSAKKETLEKEQTRLEWTQDAWKELNDKIYKFWNKALDNMRWESSYMKKKTTIGDSSIATVSGASNAATGSQTLAVKQLARTAYLTGAKMEREVTSESTLFQAGVLKPGESAEIKVNDTTIKLETGMTIEGLCSELNKAGVSASFDETNQRFFISAKKSGAEGDFTISGDTDALKKLGLLTPSDEELKWAEIDPTSAEFTTEMENAARSYYEEVQQLTMAKKSLEDEYAALQNKQAAGPLSEYENERLQVLPGVIQKYGDDITAKSKFFDTSGGSPVATADLRTELEKKITDAKDVRDWAKDAGAVRIQGADAIIELNGAEFTSSTGNFSINGLTITAQTVSEKNADGTYKTTTLNTVEDVDGIYDMVKDFLKEYNELIKEMDTLYNADSAKGYDPLTSEEKDALSDDEVEKWEKKIKDSLLRRDQTLGSVTTTLKQSMLASFTINGKNYGLATFGISTLSYFSAQENEHGIYHIDGDSDDDDTSANTDKLKAAIAEDPEAVMKFFSQLANNMYDKMYTYMKSNDYSSRNKVYDDKRMASEYDAYKDKIKAQEEKLQKIEDRYYSQFTAMEKALAKLNSQQSALSSLFSS